MRPTRSVAVVAFTIAMLLLGTKLVGAQPQPQQEFGAGGGMIYGTVYGFTYDDGLVPIAWATVHAYNGRFTFNASTSEGGGYEMFVPQGTWNVTVAQPGYVSQATIVAVSAGSSSAINFTLNECNCAVPEFPSGMASVLAVLALAAVLVAVKRTKRRK